MTKVLIPRSDSVSAKVIEPSDFEELHSYVPDHIKSGFTVAAGSGLQVTITSGKIRLKGLHLNNTATETLTVTASNTNHIYAVLARDSNSEAESWSITSNTTGSAPSDSIKIATCVASGSAVTSVDQTFLDTKREPAYVPTGVILMWHGDLADIPTGWVLCDGSNGTPNLIAKFIRGISTSSTDPGTTGGEDAHSLTEAELASHTHIWSGGTSGVQPGFTGQAPNPIAHFHMTASQYGRSNTVVTTGTNANTGSGTAHENRPAFYEVAYIMKT